MRLGVFLFLASILLEVSADSISSYTPDTPVVEAEFRHSARIRVDNVPEGVDKIKIVTEELDDLTGNAWEEGYEFAYSSALPTFYYPELDSTTYHVFRVKVHKDDEWSLWSDSSEYAHSSSDNFVIYELERNWHDAKQHCISEGMHLAMLKKEDENTEVADDFVLQFGDTVDDAKALAWIGLFDANWDDDDANESEWEWVDGHTLGDFDDFEYGADENSVLESSAVGINLDGDWETRDPQEKHIFICEVPKKDFDTDSQIGMSANIVLTKRER